MVTQRDVLPRDRAIEALSELGGTDQNNQPWTLSRLTATAIVDAILADGHIMGNGINDEH